MSLSMPPGTLRTASIQTKEYLNNTNGDEATYRGNSVLPPAVVSRKTADSFSQARIRDDSFAEPPGIDGGAGIDGGSGIDGGLMENPPGVLQSSPDEGFIIKRPRQFSQDTVGSSDMESIPRMSVTSLPSPGLPEQISSENHPSFSSISTSVTKKQQQPRRETYTSPASVPSTNSATNSENAPSKEKENPTISASSSLALDISLRVSSDTDEDEITKQTRIDIAKRLGVPLSCVTIVGCSDTTTATTQESMRSKRM